MIWFVFCFSFWTLDEKKTQFWEGLSDKGAEYGEMVLSILKNLAKSILEDPLFALLLVNK